MHMIKIAEDRIAVVENVNNSYKVFIYDHLSPRPRLLTTLDK